MRKPKPMAWLYLPPDLVALAEDHTHLILRACRLVGLAIYRCPALTEPVIVLTPA